MAQQEVRIPDIGDVEDVEVIEILGSVGAEIAVDDPLIVIESDKASMEVPAPVAGKLLKVTVAMGDKVVEGQVIAVVETAEVAASSSEAAPADEAEAAETEAGASAAPAAEPVKTSESRKLEVHIPDVGDAQDIVVIEVAVKAGQDVEADDLLVVVESDKASMEIPAPVAGRIVSVDVEEGASVSEGSLLVVIETTQAPPAPNKPDKMTEAQAAPKQTKPSKPTEAAKQTERVDSTASSSDANAEAERTSAPSVAAAGADVYAGPAVRRRARELGVDLTQLTGTGARDRIVKSDVDSFVKAALTSPRGATGGGIPPIPVIDFARFGAIDTIDLTRIRLRGAENLHRSWLNIPHVTQHDEADITDLEAFRGEIKADPQAKGVKLTPLAFIVKAVVSTLQAFPIFNASLDASVRRLIVKHYYHIGLAVDTPDGLVVPVLRDADQKGVLELAMEIESLSQKAQQGKLAMSELQGASFSISSLGAIGGTGFTPIINAPEVAILGVSRAAVKPQWNGSEFAPRTMLPISLSYDHRAINGAEAGRFVTSLCRTLADMRRVLL